MKKIVALVLLTFLSVSCLKTAEQVQRERKFETMTEQMKDSQGLLADMMTQIKEMQGQMDRMNGRLEELEHRQGKLNPEQLTKNGENLALLQSQQQTQAEQLVQIQNELKEQRSFIEKVTERLSSVSSGSAAKSNKKKNAKAQLTAALDLVTKDDFSEARSELEALIDARELSPGDTNRLYHGLGRVEYFTKNYDKALVYFSKVYGKYPKASLAPSSLLFIARTLKKLEKNNEAKEAYAKLAEDYPGSKEAKEAQKDE